MFGTRRALLSSRRSPYVAKVLSIQRANLLAYWPMGEPAGSQAADASGNGRAGAYTGVALGQPGIGNGTTAPYFNGTSAYVNAYSDSLRDAWNGGELTISLWFKMLNAGVWADGAVRMVARFATVDNNNRILIQKNSAASSFAVVYIAGAVNKTITKSSFAPTGWTHLALTVSKTADQMKLYYNGVQEGATLTGLGTWANQLISTAVLLGALTTTPTQVHNGNLAHVAAWNTALAAADIAKLAVISG